MAGLGVEWIDGMVCVYIGVWYVCMWQVRGKGLRDGGEIEGGRRERGKEGGDQRGGREGRMKDPDKHREVTAKVLETFLAADQKGDQFQIGNRRRGEKGGKEGRKKGEEGRRRDETRGGRKGRK